MTKKINSKYSFIRGWNKVRQKDVKNIRKDLMDVLGITTNPSFLARRCGRVEPKLSEAAAIEGVFAKYGITDIWGAE